MSADTDDQIVMPQIKYAIQTPSMANVPTVAGMSATSAMRLVSFFLKTSTYASTRLVTAPRRIAIRPRPRDMFPSSIPFCSANSSTSSVPSPTSASSSTRTGSAASNRTQGRPHERSCEQQSAHEERHSIDERTPNDHLATGLHNGAIGGKIKYIPCAPRPTPRSP